MVLEVAMQPMTFCLTKTDHLEPKVTEFVCYDITYCSPYLFASYEFYDVRLSIALFHCLTL
ncbi:hypothetical protein Hanom_Chr16g01520531 [Helianthus anomalus]